MSSKEVFLPTIEELYLLEELLKKYHTKKLRHGGVYNSYQYLKAKAIEKMIITSNGQNILRQNQEYLVDDDMAISIAKMYPKEVINFPNLAQNSEILLTILEEVRIPSTHPLDNLSYFDPSVINSSLMKKNILYLLNEELKRNPQYRFTYQSSIILDNIFNGHFLESLINATNVYSKQEKADLYKQLVAIDPTYIVKTSLKDYNHKRDKNYNLEDFNSRELLEYDRQNMIGYNINNYCHRYYLPSVYPISDLQKTIDDIPQAKKLIKYLNIK